MKKLKKATIGSHFHDDFRGQLLGWYDAHQRSLPWRLGRMDEPNPYFTWLSEIMLQQTVVATVIPYFLKFTAKWATIHDLAAADVADVMHEWAGLGYYARARNLHKCAKVVSGELGGEFPSDVAALKKLPGIGDYTAAAISTIAFNKPATVVDGNIERVMTRIFAVTNTLPGIKPRLKELAAPFFDGFHARPGDLAQAMMDLGAGICTPKSPKCALCPVSEHCQARIKGIADTLPRKAPKKAQPQKIGNVYFITNKKGQILLERRADKGMLGGMVGLPTSEWVVDHPVHIEGFKSLKLTANSHIKHSFTHFDLRLDLYMAQSEGEFDGYFWDEIDGGGLPTLFKKAYKLACG